MIHQRIYRRRSPLNELLEPKLNLAPLALAEHSIVEPVSANFSDIISFDIDQDDDSDLVVASSASSGPAIAWYENLDGQGRFGPAYVIHRFEGIRSLDYADIDADGDLDLVSAGENKIAWYENEDGAGKFGHQRIISTDAYFAQRVVTVDLDDDNDLDVVSVSDRRIAWYENLDNGQWFGRQRQIAYSSTRFDDRIQLGDFDQDGDPDIIARGGSERYWLENLGADGLFANQPHLVEEIKDGRPVGHGDLDGDGDLDLLAATLDSAVGKMTIVWHENVDAGQLGPAQPIGPGYRASVADLDRDQTLDVLVVTDLDSTLYRNSDGLGTFETGSRIAGSVRNVRVVDVDSDDDPDLLISNQTSGELNVHWRENTDGNGAFGLPQIILSDEQYGWTASTGDIDGDGDIDIVSTSKYGGSVVWFENRAESGKFATPQTIAQNLGQPGSTSSVVVVLADLDSDDDLDVMYAWRESFRTAQIGWYENRDGRGDFRRQNVLASPQEPIAALFAADVDLDGDEDLIFVEDVPGTSENVGWYENLGGALSAPKMILTRERGPLHIEMADIDNDQDLDLFVATWAGLKVAWYENTDGDFGVPHVVTEDVYLGETVKLGDVDRDGDLDILHSGEMGWYENTDSAGTFDRHHSISTDPRAYHGFLEPADVDADGDLDVFAAGRDGAIGWFENTNGTGQFGPMQELSPAREGQGREYDVLLAGDFNSDESADLLTVSRFPYLFAWQEVRVLGDADGDGRFGTSDIVAVMIAGKYNLGFSGAPTFDEGDWNRDGVFDHNDFVFAWIGGHYEQPAARPIESVAVIEWLFSKKSWT